MCAPRRLLAPRPRDGVEARGMTLHVALAVSALAASVLLVASSQQRVLPVIALVAAAVETAVAFGYLRVAINGVPLGLLLGLALALPGLVGWLRATAKGPISAAAVLAFTGVLQVAVYVGARL
ncbi:hypothetical protein Anae109_3794 [Anaeromyxobacter sp. Fw109-5]|nr:hypothetical protein Anae109_3794 [Anaeromyxobacter sp. Fw109-5]